MRARLLFIVLIGNLDLNPLRYYYVVAKNFKPGTTRTVIPNMFWFIGGKKDIKCKLLCPNPHNDFVRAELMFTSEEAVKKVVSTVTISL
jgi:hypothetical protein